MDPTPLGGVTWEALAEDEAYIYLFWASTGTAADDPNQCLDEV